MAKKEKETKPDYLSSVVQHYNEAESELSTRVTHKEQGFDEYDRLYRSYIEKGKWPFNSRIFIPLAFTSLFGKATRLITGKIKGRLVATQYGNNLSARIGTQLLSSQYDEHDDHFEEPMIMKWVKMDQGARKYGAGFGLVAWRKETRNGKVVFDGPVFEYLDNRKVLLQPGTTSVTDSDYVIVEREATIDELERVNEQSLAKYGSGNYENLDKLRAAASGSQGDSKYPSTNTVIRGLGNRRGSKETGKFKRFRILTEYRRDKWITWCPDVGGDNDAPGLILKVGKNPYNHGQIPIIRLVYIPIDDDIYGVSELEPGRSSQKAVNALTSGFIEAVSTELYPIIKGHPTNVDWKTIEFKPRAAWIMNSPQTDIVRLEGAVTFTRNFVEAYKLLVSQFSNAVGDTTADSSQLAQLETAKTATEIKDLAMKRGSRDNLNKIFLASAITKMYYFWWSMNQQFLTDQKVIRVAGKEALKYFIDEGLNEYTLREDGYNLIEQFMNENPGLDFNMAYEVLREEGILEEYAVPMFPMKQEGQVLPKMELDPDGKSGFLTVDNKDLTGQYRFSVDLNTIGVTSEAEEAQNMIAFLDRTEKLDQLVRQEGYRTKYKEILEEIAEKMQIKNPDQFFEELDETDMQQDMPQMPGVQPQPGMQPGMEQQEQLQPQQLMGGINEQVTV